MALLRSYIDDTKGTFALYCGIGFLVLLMAVGCAIDISQMSSHKSKLSDLADNTAVAGAVVANEDEIIINGELVTRKEVAEDYFEENKYVDGLINVNEDPDITFDDALAEVTVTVSADVEFIIMGIFGFNDPTISATSKVAYKIDDIAPLSIAFAFDRSGSMNDLSGGEAKIDALRTATNDLFYEIENASKNVPLLQQQMSTAFSGYNESLQETSQMATGYDHVETAVNSLVADGWTRMGPSLQFAQTELDAKKASETDNRWVGHVVFMTDGKNDWEDPTLLPAWDAETLAQCDALKAAGYQVYSVAFAAPPEGEAILQTCASSLAHYFDSANSQDLKDAFRVIGKEIGSSTIRIKA